MEYGIASLRGRTFRYRYSTESKVLISKSYDKHFIANRNAFNYLYLELDDSRAALKEDCVEYVIYNPDEPLSSYPEWFIAAYDNGFIYEEEDYDEFIFYHHNGDVVMSAGSLVLRNYKGEITYMEMCEFNEHYET